MNENSQSGFGKISIHGDGLGAPTPQLIEQRARELAMIEERDPENFTDAHWDQARRELMGVQSPTAPEELEGLREPEDEHEFVPATEGHRAPRAGADGDDETVGESLVSGGLEEAAHDQMVEARREELEHERED